MNQKLISFLFTSCFVLFFAKGFCQTLYGFINTRGEEVIPAKFESVGDFVNGLAPAKINGKWGYINKKGEFVIQPTYGYAENYKNGFAKASFAANALYFDYLNTEGKVFAEGEIYTEPLYFSGLKIIKVGDKYGYRDTKGNVVIPAIYDGAKNFNSSGWTSVQRGNSYALINKYGKELSNFDLGYIGEFEGGYIQVSNKNNEYFIYDSTGKYIKINNANFVYKPNNSLGWFGFKQNNKYGFMNSKGEIVVAPIYDNVNCDGKLFFGLENNVIHVFDITNITKELHSFTPLKPSGFYNFRDGVGFYVDDTYSHREGCIDIYGKVVIPAIYANLRFLAFNEGLIGFQKADPVKGYVSNSAASSSSTTSATNNTQPQSPTTTRSGNFSSSSYALDIFSELGSMALYVGNNMYVVKIKGKTLGDQATVAARAAQVAGVRSSYKYQWFPDKNCITLKNQYSSAFTIYCNGEIDLR